MGFRGILWDKTKKQITQDNYREPITRFDANCVKYAFNENLIIILSHDILRDYMIIDLGPLFYKKVSEKKLREEKEKLEFNKNTLNKSGLQ